MHSGFSAVYFTLEGMARRKQPRANARKGRGVAASAKVKVLFERTRRRIRAIEKKALAKLGRRGPR
jgi:DNA-directed RNA polymerase sigma subunit (sigma70/sigma32)